MMMENTLDLILISTRCSAESWAAGTTGTPGLMPSALKGVGNGPALLQDGILGL